MYENISSAGMLKYIKMVAGLPFTLRRRLLYRKMLREADSTRRFEVIYENGLWRSEESLSGTGSTISSTKNLRDELPLVLERHGIKSILDAPCGDFNWMAEFLKSNSMNSYIGADIVEQVIKHNSDRFTTDNVSFRRLDITTDTLPTVDLMLVRDCLFHLSYEDIDKFLRNFSRSNIKYLLTTSHISTNKSKVSNVDIMTGDFRLIDILEKPFSFKQLDIIEQIVESTKGSPKKMLLFEKKNVPDRLEMPDI